MLPNLRPALLLATLAAASSFSCGGDAADVASGDEGISTRTYAYVTLARDFRRCAYPLCGGFWVRDVNRNREPVYVSELDFSEAGFDQETITRVVEAPVEELVIRGRLGAAEPRFQTRPLKIKEAYRGLPGANARDSDAFFTVETYDPPKQCITAPCNNHQARRLNLGGRARSVTTIDLAPIVETFVDGRWLSRRVTHHGAIVAGRIEQGQSFPAGRETLLVASQVFVRLPDTIGPCPELAIRCAPGFVATFDRNEDRCITPQECVVPASCGQTAPECAEGYELVTWATSPDACPAYACDPSFVIPPAPIGRCAVVRCGPGTRCTEDGPDACVPLLTCASMLCAPSSHCVESSEDGGDARCVADVWVEERVAVQSESPYRNDERRAWIFTSDAPGTQQVRLSFARFDLEDGYDFVIIQDAAGNELARYTGRLGPFTSQIFPGSSLRIVFTTDGSVTRPGFAIDRIDARTN